MSESKNEAVPPVAVPKVVSTLAERERFFLPPWLSAVCVLGAIILTSGLAYTSSSPAAPVLASFSLILQLVVLVFLTLLIYRTRQRMILSQRKSEVPASD